ncbi:PepSY-associated TM helix domain-containing protein [Asaia lannensis]|uniref:PepSY domain-containing protein n=1 Tax=Asaia lannensis NBRC 102526 TaxID=1307926 RepID=A0ABT1CCU4_9PROT|nr:PepSY-associated TM helix domain-containing protein [Asaia lannensis]MCO6158680.1 PepSY domain-containing protein [Asaia lannensis NBRC 102526]
MAIIVTVPDSSKRHALHARAGRSRLDRVLWPLRPGRKTLLSLHRYIGLVLAPLLVIIGLTGSISVFRVELDRALNPDLFTTRHHDNHLTLSDLVARLERQHPDQSVVALEYRPTSHDTVHAYLTPFHNRAGSALPDEIFLDPSDGHELGGRLSEGCCLGRRALLPFIYRVHYSLAAGQTGLWILGIAALIWSLDCLNGLILTLPPVTPPWRRAFWPGWKTSWQISRPRNALRLFFDLHRALGLWLWLILLGMAISGVALALGPQLFQPVIRHVFPMAAPPPILPLPGGPHRLTLEDAESRAYALVSTRGITARPAALILTHRPDTALFYLFSETGQFPAGFGSPLVTIDLETGGATQTIVPPQGHLGDIILQIQDPFHSGRLAGLAGRILVCASGIVTALLSITGILIWQRKRQAHRRAMLKAERRGKA